MAAITACSLLVLWITPLPLEGRTIGSQLVESMADRSTPLYQAVVDLQKLASASSPSSKEAVDLLHHFSPPKRSIFDILPSHQSSKRAVFDILPHRMRSEEEEVQSRKFDCSRLVRSLSRTKSWKSHLANQSKLKSLIKKLVRKYILLEKIRLLRNGRNTESSVMDEKRKNLLHSTSSSRQQNH